MSNKKFTILLFIIASFGISTLVNCQTPSKQISFSFTLAKSAKTSAGVYKSDGTLIRTLWSGVDYSAGTFTEKWDGVNDSGLVAPSGNYNVKLLSNNLNYQWEGVVGNTSINRTGTSHYNAMDIIWGMAISGNNAYIGTNYNEQQSSSQKFLVSNPQAKTDVLGKGAEIKYVATDDNYVYWGGDDPNTYTSLVFVTKVSNDLEATLSSATPFQTKYGRKYNSAIDTLSGTVNTTAKYTTAFITGLAVQKTGNYLFVARSALNSIRVINKTTGVFIRNISISNPKGLALDQSGNFIWVIDSLTAKKYPVNANGTIGPVSNSIAGFQNTLSVALSPDNSTVVIADGGNSQQLKAYSNSSAASSWTYGQAGGYTNGPAVTNNKFMFWELYNSAIIQILSYVAFAPDGSFWTGDPGNCRNLHFSSGRTYIEQIMFHGCSYSIRVDKNSPGRVFNNYLEFAVDYSKPLDNGNNGSWILKNNWAGNLNPIYDDQFNRLLCVATLSNGRTYCLSQYDIANGKYEVLELTSGGIRYTGIIVQAAASYGMSLYPDGSLRSIGRRKIGSNYSFIKQSLAGFDPSGNPSWNKSVTLASTPVITSQDPGYTGNSTTLKPGEVTTSGLLIAFGSDLTSTDYHLGAINPATNQWLWKTAKGSSTGYTGVYPTDGAFDVGNGVNSYAGSVALALGNNILWGYHGEFWKNSEVNKWTMVHDDGLMIGTFGVTGLDTASVHIPFTGMAGNSFCANLIYSPIDTTIAYLYHNDESVHGGVHRWKISGLNTINVQILPVVLSLGSHGLLGSYFTGTNLNSTDISVSRVDNIINAIVTPANTTSSRWTGFIQPGYSENYTFYANSSAGSLLWVNDSLIINKWSGSNAPYSSTSLPLVAGSLYTIRMETSNSNQASLSWSSKSQTKQVVSTIYLYPASATDTTNGIDLLEGLASSSIVNTNMYGWTKTPLAEDYTSSSQYWSVKTNVKNYSNKNPDLYTRFNSNSGVYTLSRDLGTNNTATSWTLSGELNYQGNFPNHGTGGGAYFEVLDRAGKIISRFYPGSGTFPTSYLYGNNKIITQSTDANLKDTMAITQAVNITATSNGITFSYGNYAPVTAPIFDITAKWRQPQSMRLYFFGNGTNYTCIIDIQSMRFSSDALSSPNPPSPGDYYRTVASGNWSNVSTWQSSADSISWVSATVVPSDTSNSITIQNGHTVDISGTVTVDQLHINNGGTLNVTPNSAVIINDGVGQDIDIATGGSMVIKSDSTGTGQIGNSSGTVNGEATVERYLSSFNNVAYRVLAPSVNTVQGTKPYIRDNWQEGQNNTSTNTNNDNFPNYGTHITGSTTGANGFDATSAGDTSLFTFDQKSATQAWVPISNTNNTNLDAQKGYQIFIRGNRSVDLKATNNSSSSNTTLRATGKILTGDQTFANLESDGRLSLVTNPYACSINWNSIYNDKSTTNAANFENYFIYWDPNIGTTGGYVSVNTNGTKSALTNATVDIQPGEAFFIVTKHKVFSPVFTIKESHKSDSSNVDIYHYAIPEKLKASLYFTDADGVRTMADGVTAVFTKGYSTAINRNNKAIDLANPNENIAIARNGQLLSIEERLITGTSDTLPLMVERLKAQNYEWQFDPTQFVTRIPAYLEDNYLNTRTPFSLIKTSVIPFTVNSDTASFSRDRFQVVFGVINKPNADTIKGTGDFQIYPNPVTGNSFNLHFNNVDKGIYTVRLISTNGQILTSKAVTHTGGTATQIIPISTNLSKGMYIVNITGVNKAESKSILVQ